MKKTILIMLLLAIVISVGYPYIARIRQDTRIYDVVEQEWTWVRWPWFVQVDYAVAEMCYIEWNTQVNPDPVFYHHEGWIPCELLTNPIQ